MTESSVLVIMIYLFLVLRVWKSPINTPFLQLKSMKCKQFIRCSITKCSITLVLKIEFEFYTHAIVKSTLFTVSKDEWDTKDTGKSMKNALYILRYAKRHLLGQSDVKQ